MLLLTMTELMEMCTKHAIDGVNNDIGGPFGACICRHYKSEVSDENLFELISLARNTVVSTNDPTNHAEMNAIRQACEKLKTFDLSDCILITTGQSCPMCLSAAMWARIPTVFYGTTYDDATKIGFIDDHIHQHLKGEIEVICEQQFRRNMAIKCHEAWIDKEQKVQY